VLGPRAAAAIDDLISLFTLEARAVCGANEEGVAVPVGIVGTVVRETGGVLRVLGVLKSGVLDVVLSVKVELAVKMLRDGKTDTPLIRIGNSVAIGVVSGCNVVVLDFKVVVAGRSLGKYSFLISPIADLNSGSEYSLTNWELALSSLLLLLSLPERNCLS